MSKDRIIDRIFNCAEDWNEIQIRKVNYQAELENIPIEEIQRFLRKKKLQNISEI